MRLLAISARRIRRNPSLTIRAEAESNCGVASRALAVGTDGAWIDRHDCGVDVAWPACRDKADAGHRPWHLRTSCFVGPEMSPAARFVARADERLVRLPASCRVVGCHVVTNARRSRFCCRGARLGCGAFGFDADGRAVMLPACRASSSGPTPH